MKDWSLMLKSKLEKAFSMPFDVSMSIVEGEEQYVCSPQNEEYIYFTVQAYIHNQIRLVVDVEPQKNAGDILYEMTLADEPKQKIFFQYIDLLRSKRAKVDFYVNNELLTFQKAWPEKWRYFKCHIVLLPIPETNTDEEILFLLSEWMIHGTALVLSLLTIDETESVLQNNPQQEGNAKEVRSIRYERSRINRELCLAHKGYSCMVCGFNFVETYGDLGKDFIEVHHTTPVSEMGDNYTIDIDRDLVPLCSNCHSMIHKKTPPLTIEELKRIIAKGKEKGNKEVAKPEWRGRNVEQRLIPQGSILQSIEDDNKVRILIHNMMELCEGTSILKIVTECQKEFQMKYFSMRGNDWRHLIGDYVRKVTEQPNLQDQEIFRYMMTG